MSGRGSRRRRRRRGEQIKSCQMEILGFKRSETGVKRVRLFESSLCYANRDKYLWLDAVSSFSLFDGFLSREKQASSTPRLANRAQADGGGKKTRPEPNADPGLRRFVSGKSRRM